ncbi:MULTISPECIES: DUF4870 domain-containing protein [Aneurinibacillus]|jgi:ABC-type xylose transport system permease subunit|uniref:DUF4870 domain-containing protein n=1 Tax=Aneurinibacillus thermoaerophilus TaxID=143495 RepID=A0A1G8AU20_ANETH|nr:MULTISPECIES: DUF4870 domain-containing protein [Aneurinibacillus]AMA72840.1 hypothetical protein ACH33_08225 [Aneurinibacillus sp. XH2]MED0675226.1 DUF4870 domain-containing protein [Aneurinibacillus thermoaerophilus]MED0738164.1 DUF4870 domain-containing protein [Aneurinibacillus thermoaerophilus]SDH24458.1 hypothetical protein SAMN04489735_101817 [Aneurinibacillus thermoaerophilus]
MNVKPACVIIHGSTFFAPVLIPLLFYFLSDHPYIKEKAMEALLFHVLMIIALFISSLLVIVLIGFVLLLIFSLIGIYYPIKGIVYALQERPFHYPIVHGWVK